MLKQKIKYTDYNGKEREETFYFNMSAMDARRLIYSKPEGFKNFIDQKFAENDLNPVIDLFEDIILSSYGEKSEDGTSFVKSPEISKKFSQTAAYEALVDMFFEKDGFINEFFMGVLPANLSSKYKEVVEAGNGDVQQMLKIVEQ